MIRLGCEILYIQGGFASADYVLVGKHYFSMDAAATCRLKMGTATSGSLALSVHEN